MSIQLNIPSSPNQGGPVNLYELIPLAAIDADGNNAYELQLAGALGVLINNNSNAPLMVQFLPQGSLNNQPLPVFINPGQERMYAWGYPLSGIILSNLSMPYVPLFQGNLYPSEPQNQSITTGTILVSATNAPLTYVGQDAATNLGTQSLQVGLEQDALASGTAQANGTTNVSLSLTPDINGLLIGLDNSANVSHVQVTGDATGIAYFAQANPYADLIAVPIMSCYDTSVNVAITMPVGEACDFWVSGRRDSLLSSILQLTAPTVSVTGTGAGSSIPVVNGPTQFEVVRPSVPVAGTTPFTWTGSGHVQQSLAVPTGAQGLVLWTTDTSDWNLIVTGSPSGAMLYNGLLPQQSASVITYNNPVEIPISLTGESTLELTFSTYAGESAPPSGTYHYAYAWVYDTSTVVPINQGNPNLKTTVYPPIAGNGSLPVQVTDTLGNPPTGPISNQTALSVSIGTDSTAFTRPTWLLAAFVSLGASSTAAAEGVAALLGLKGVTSSKVLWIAADSVGVVSGQYLALAFGQSFSPPINLAEYFPGDTQLKATLAGSESESLGGSFYLSGI